MDRFPHPSNPSVRRPAGAAFGPVAAALLALAGCGSHPELGTQADMGRAAGLESAVAFHSSGGAIDAPPAGPDATGELSLEQAVRLAVVNDPKLQQAVARVRAAEADADQARLLPNPVASIAVRFREGGGSPIIDPALSTDLIAILRMPRRVGAADHRLRAASAAALQAVLDSVSAVQAKYAAVQALDEHVVVLRQRMTLTQQLLDLKRAQAKAGEAAAADVLVLDADRVAVEAEIADRELDRNTARLALARLIGRPAGRTDWTLAGWRAADPVRAAESAWVAAALDRRPEVQAVRWELAALGDEVALASLSPFEGTTAGAQAERDVDWSVGPEVTVPLPIFDWGQAARVKARAQQIEARHKLTDARRTVVEEVRRSYQTFAAAQAAVGRMRQELIPLQERRVAQARASYQAGEAALFVVIEAQRDLQESREKLVDLQQKSSTALFELQRAAGGAAVAEEVENAAGPAGPTTAPTTRP